MAVFTLEIIHRNVKTARCSFRTNNHSEFIRLFIDRFLKQIIRQRRIVRLEFTLDGKNSFLSVYTDKTEALHLQQTVLIENRVSGFLTTDNTLEEEFSLTGR